jgi:hypothetical protein
MKQSLSTNLKHVAFGSKVQIYDNLQSIYASMSAAGGRSHPLYPGDYIMYPGALHSMSKPFVLLGGRRGLL